MRRYRVRLPLTVHTDTGSYTQDEEFDKEFSEEEETTNLDSGLLELIPCKYRVIGGSYVFDTAPGGEFDAAMRIGQEGLLVAGGHIERIEETNDEPGNEFDTTDRSGEVISRHRLGTPAKKESGES